MSLIAKIVSQEVASLNPSGEPVSWRVVFDNGNDSWSGYLDEKGLRQHDMLYRLQESGVDMEVVGELISMGFQRGQDSVLD